MNLALEQIPCDRNLAPLKNKHFPSTEEEALLHLAMSCIGEDASAGEIREFITGRYEEVYAKLKSSHKDDSLFQKFKGFRYTVRLKAIIDLRRRLDLIEKTGV